jgi:myo-inositol-1(or 4)-monophosphatase
MVSIAAVAPLAGPAERLTLGDTSCACLAEIVGRRVFYAERGRGAEWREGSEVHRPRLSRETDLDRIAWSLGIVGRPAGPLFEVMGELVDRTSLTGGFFSCNSIAYSLTRLVTGQLDAALDIANRIYRDRADTHAAFAQAGGGAIMGLCPYDIAAALLVAQEAGCAVSDAYGRSLDATPAFGPSPQTLQSCIAAGNPVLHERLLAYVNAHLAPAP